MGAIRMAAAPALPVSLAEVKAYARIATSDEEALLTAMVRRRPIFASASRGDC